MRAFAEVWPDSEFVQGVLAQLPWYHQLALLDNLRTADERRWYRVIDRRVHVYLIADGRRDMQALLARRLLGA